MAEWGILCVHDDSSSTHDTLHVAGRLGVLRGVNENYLNGFEATTSVNQFLPSRAESDK
jgi:hypothetical protein